MDELVELGLDAAQLVTDLDRVHEALLLLTDRSSAQILRDHLPDVSLAARGGAPPEEVKVGGSTPPLTTPPDPPAVAFGYLAAWMLLALVMLGWARDPSGGRSTLAP